MSSLTGDTPVAFLLIAPKQDTPTAQEAWRDLLQWNCHIPSLIKPSGITSRTGVGLLCWH